MSNRKSITVFDTQKMPELNDFLISRLNNFQTNTNANIASEHLSKAYADGIASFSKTYKPSRRKSSIKPWITPSILCSINKKTQLYNKFLRRGNRTNENNYKRYRNVLVQTIRDAKKLYFKDALKQNKNNGKVTWDLLNQVVNKSHKKQNNYPDTFYDSQGKAYNKPDVPNGFNVFFSSIGHMLDKEIPKIDNDPLNYLNELDYEPYVSTPQATATEIEKIIKSLNSVGGGIDRISTQILLGTYRNIIHHLTFFINLCLRKAVFPNNLKVAIITPIHKAGSKDTFTNYRPISLLPIISKILEKIIYLTLSPILETNDLLNPLQFGFRKQHSTYMPIAHMNDEITKNLQENEITCILYLDLKKAFDSVCIEILLRKIYYIGIRGSLYDIIDSYLCNRQQITKINHTYSDKQAITVGVPQGSILGPLLFIMYINDMPNITDLASFYVFADDTAVMIKAKSIEQLQIKVNQLMPIVTKWFQTNRLSLNASKSSYQIFSRNRSSDINISLENTKIERKACVRYLGMYVDENLKWHSHIAYVLSIISRNLGIMGRAKHLLSARELILLYNALILPHLSYCAIIWGINYESNIRRIKIFQKRAVRIIDKKPFLYPSNGLFIQHKILKFTDIVKEQSIVILLAHINNTMPKPISNLFKFEESKNTRQTKHFFIPTALRNYRAFALSCSAPRIWNTVIGAMFKNIEDVPRNKLTLKKQVRKHFFEEYSKIS